MNALRVVTVLGGSTNAVLHLLAMANTLDLSITIEDFQQISDQTPLLGDLKPSGQYLMEDLHRIGGLPAVMKYMLSLGMLDGNCMTITGKTLSENLADVPELTFNQDIFRPVQNPLKPSGHLRILFGNLATEGCVAKITGKEGEYFTGKAIVFDSEPEANEAISAGKIQAGHVVVIRYVGPKGGPGMPEMLKPTSSIMGLGLGQQVALITDGRFSGGTHGFVVGHISPEAYDGGTIALIQDGDVIHIDAIKNEIHLQVDKDELASRKANWECPSCPIQRGYLTKYRKTVSSASLGCVTDLN